MPRWNSIDQLVFLWKALLNMFKQQQQQRSSSHIKWFRKWGSEVSEDHKKGYLKFPW